MKIYDELPGEIPHGWKFIKIGPDGKLYVPVGAPCNICDPSSDKYAHIRRINLDGSGMEIVARGVRNTVGFDFHPKTGELWFTDNQRDWLSEDMPNDELNRLTKPGQQHFGYPYCHQGDFADPEFGWGKSCDDFVKPAALLGPHSAPLGMRFYTGKMFPAKYQGAIFIARHGPWNRTKKYAGDVVVALLDTNGKVTKVEPFLTGLVENNAYLGRPVDVLVLKDGSLLVSDDHNGAVYRISYCEVAALARGAALAALLLLAPAAPPLPHRSKSAWRCAWRATARRAVADSRHAVARRAARLLRRRAALPVPPRRPDQRAHERGRQTHDRRRPPRLRRVRREAAAARAAGEPADAARFSAARGWCCSVPARPATTPTSRAASRCRAWPTSARTTCSRRCASTRAARASATAGR